MPLPLRAALLVLALFASTAHAEAIAPAAQSSACIDSDLEAVSAGAGGAWLYRIVFRNRCGVQRSLYWCADNPAAAPPEQVACPRAARAGDAPAEPRHVVLHRKEFQWHLPPGTRIRYRDCPPQELPTYGMGCATAAAAAGSTARR